MEMGKVKGWFEFGLVVVEHRDYTGDFLRVHEGLVKKEKALEWIEDLRKAGYKVRVVEHEGVVKAFRGLHEYLFYLGGAVKHD